MTENWRRWVCRVTEQEHAAGAFQGVACLEHDKAARLKDLATVAICSGAIEGAKHSLQLQDCSRYNFVRDVLKSKPWMSFGPEPCLSDGASLLFMATPFTVPFSVLMVMIASTLMQFTPVTLCVFKRAEKITFLAR